MEGFKRSESSRKIGFLQLLSQLIPVVVYNVTFFCLNETYTKTTLEITTHVTSESEELTVEEEITKRLTEKKLLNWCRTITKLAVVKNNSRGRSSLLKAVSKAMWGIDNRDVENYLQQLMDTNLSSARESARIKERWELETKRRKVAEDHSSNFSSSNKYSSWEEICKAFHDIDGVWDGRTEDVDSIHIFILSNVIKRPILIIESSGEENSRNDLSLTGLYLPSLLDMAECVKSPLVLTCEDQSFYATLVQPDLEVGLTGGRHLKRVKAVPLVTNSFEQFPIRCLADEDHRNQGFTLIQSYLNIDEIPYTGPNALNQVLVARLSSIKPDFIQVPGQRNPSSCSGEIYSNISNVSQKCDEREKAATKGANNYAGAVLFISGLKCSVPECNEPIDEESYPKCRVHARKLRKCIVEFCDREGVEEYEGKCRLCYVKGNDDRGIEWNESRFSGELKSTDDHTYEREVWQSGEPWRYSETKYERQMSEQPKCKEVTCKSTGLSIYGGFCIECFNKNWKGKKKKVPTATLR